MLINKFSLTSAMVLTLGVATSVFAETNTSKIEIKNENDKQIKVSFVPQGSHLKRENLKPKVVTVPGKGIEEITLTEKDLHGKSLFRIQAGEWKVAADTGDLMLGKNYWVVIPSTTIGTKVAVTEQPSQSATSSDSAAETPAE